MSAAQCDALGVDRSRRGRLVAAGIWARVVVGVLDVAPVDRLHPEERRRRAAFTGLLAYGPHAVAVGSAALVLHGVAGLPVAVVPQVALPGAPHVRGRGGVRVRRFGIDGIAAVGGGRAVPLVHALAQAVPELPRDHAVAVLDDVLRRGLLDADGLDRARGLAVGRRGAARARRWWDLVDARAESPLETFARLQCVDDGVPPDVLQVAVRGPGGAFVARCDMGWRTTDGRWLIGEIDGREFHDVAAALLHDRRRQNAISALGHTVLRFTSADVGARTVPRTVRAALTRPR
ncbi:hypothetical protein [Cellulomonas sp. SLBN-39]|uniref:hypothetical protein n=1 Tax=Cellulomonas sp. SLBN-39 TaxID=2768446 RepID=UPI001152CD29|nr:hypothetical protein [Cellulomonas sp. SLBN-39]TQL02995.1 hypothetical protein FBY24_2083 [Cellulomonas sp. SLBN-39]